MNQELAFEAMPFEVDPEFEGNSEGEDEWGRRRSFAGGGAGRYPRPRSQAGLPSRGAKRLPTPRPRPTPARPRGLRVVVREPYGLVSEPYPGEPEPSGSERVRWIQDCLNQAMGLQLPVTGVMGPETRSAVRSFQQQQGLRVSGVVSPKTEQTLSSVCEGGQDSGAPSEELEDFWEVLASNGELEEEFVIQQGCSLSYNYKKKKTPPSADVKDIVAVVPNKQGIFVANLDLPRERGVYVIKIDGKAHYVGVATSSGGVKARFDERIKALRDFGIDLQAIKNRTVDVYTVTDGTCVINRRKKNTTVPGSPVKAHAELLLLEQYLIGKLNTLGKGNRYPEGIVSRNPKDSSITVTFNGPHGVGKLP